MQYVVTQIDIVATTRHFVCMCVCDTDSQTKYVWLHY